MELHMVSDQIKLLEEKGNSLVLLECRAVGRICGKLGLVCVESNRFATFTVCRCGGICFGTTLLNFFHKCR